MQSLQDATPDPSPEIAGECPHCRAVIAYEAWVALIGEPEVMACPRCLQVCQVSEVFPPVADER